MIESWTEIMWSSLGVDLFKYPGYSYCTFIRFHRDEHGRVWSHIDYIDNEVQS